MKEKKDAVLHYRVTRSFKRQVKEAAQKDGRSETSWALRVIAKALKR